MKRFVLAIVVTLVGCAPSGPPVAKPPTPKASASISASASVPTSASGASSDPTPPTAKKEPKTDLVHGDKRVDDYFWMRKKDSPEVLSHLAAEAAYTKEMTKGSAAFEKSLYDEMLARIKETDASPPLRRGKYFHYTRTEQGKQYPIHCRRKALPNDAQGNEEVILDLNEIGKSAAFVSLGAFELADDDERLAFAIDKTGFRQYTLQFKDLRTGTIADDKIERVDSVAFARDGKTVFYVTEDATTKRPSKLFRHTIGKDPKSDALVYEEKDEKFDLQVDRSRSKEFVFVTSESLTTTEVRILEANKPEGTLRVVAPREQGHEYYLDHRGDLFWIRTNSGGRNFRIVTAKVKDPKREGWVEVVAHRDDVMLEELDVFAHFAVTIERQDAVPHVRITDFDTKATHRIELPEPVRTVLHDRNPEFDAKTFRFRYESLVTPNSVFEYDVKKREKKLLKRTEVLGGFDSQSYESELVHATARDGTKVPVAIVHRKGGKPDGTHALLLYGYGAYGWALPDQFSSDRVSLLDRDVTVAIAHVRGGGEMGKRWHDQGRMLTKMNTFTDFIDCAEHLTKNGYVGKGKLAAVGKSAGGLLMGAVSNLRPDLFKVIVADVPFVDVINTMLDESLPLTVTEFEEWGNPKIKEQYDYMLRYSPYDNVAPKAYPSMLVKSSYNDSQVMYWEPAKWVAKLRALKTDRNPLVFKINMEPAGHGGQSGRYDHLHEVAFDYAFVLGALGISK